ncbi:DNA-binding MarR family transcriptional regulator [Murinocardiopsis flavida]|uniref:DNA-binding MarR family transcriptional regulator n=1 Tax=Murinocardiopsis flavida TaxID=645275 RepID=A0A2P8D6F5_9ACTN|nr:DNA-binding MarR family transcriptional regulator [Murinocardiopsis flavida]
MLDWLEPWDDDFLPAFWAAKRAMLKAAEEAMGRHGVREGQQFILMALWREDGLSPGEIARRLGLATSTVTRAATRMVRSGLLERRPHPSDARLVNIHLTDRGRDLRDDLNAEMRRLSERALAGFTTEQRAEFRRSLERLHDNLSH